MQLFSSRRSNKCPRNTEKTGLLIFTHIALNVGVANLTAGFVWFSFTFWLYLKLQSVIIAGSLAGGYFMLTALSGPFFGRVVDSYPKQTIMRVSSAITFITFAFALIYYKLCDHDALLNPRNPAFWYFSGLLLAGATVETLRSITLTTTVTLLVPKAQRQTANGIIGLIQGIAFLAMNALSGVAVGTLGMGWALALALAATIASSIHLIFIEIPEKSYATSNHNPLIKTSGLQTVLRSVPGIKLFFVFALVTSGLDGVYLALMDPYGLTIFSPGTWGAIVGISATGSILGGLLVARFGLGPNPIQTLALSIIFASLSGIIFSLREWAWLYLLGNWLIMFFDAIAGSAKYSGIQTVVPLNHQGRIFGVFSTLQSTVTPITSFIVAPLADKLVIPWTKSTAGHAATKLLLGDGNARGMALCFIVANIVSVIIIMCATKRMSYHALSAYTQANYTSPN